MNTNGNTSLWASTVIFILLLFAVITVVDATNTKSTANTSRVINSSPAIPVTGRAIQPPNDIYTIQSGDTLTSLAERFNTTVSAILQANPQITTPGLIYAGQRLVIP